MSEAKYQAKLIKEMESQGYYVLKLIRTNKNGIPDLLALKPNEVLFVEVKGVKGVVSKLQDYRIEELQKFGFKVKVEYEKAR